MKSKERCNTSASVICTRLVHITLTIGITIVLFVKNTVVRQDLEHGHYFHSISFLLAVVTSIALYFIVACMDPGYVKQGEPDVKEIQLVVDEDDDDIDDIALYEVEKRITNTGNWDIDLNEHVHSEKTKMLGNELGNKSRAKCFNLEPHERCGLCGLQRPLRAKHCRDCKRCVRKFDHHCPWVTNCVGERNHRWFYIFLVVNMTLLAWSIHISITGYSSVNSSRTWVSENIILLLVDILMGILLVVVAILFCIHTYLIVHNNTTWETMSRNRIAYLKEIKDSVNPFNLGPCRNVFVFFCNFHPYDWTIVYSKSQKSSDTSLLESGVDVEEFCEINVDES